MKGIKVCCNDDINIPRSSFKKEVYFAIIFVVIISGIFFLKNTRTSAQSITSKLSSDKTFIDREQYQSYSEQNFQFSKARGKTVLFFAATTWCSSCVALENEIKKRITDIPTNITILKVDYDNDKKLVNSYGVTQQTTLILLNDKGEVIKRWIGTSFDNLLQNIN